MDNSNKLTAVSLFSGIGGIDIALEPWFRTITYCEIGSFQQGQLAYTNEQRSQGQRINKQSMCSEENCYRQTSESLNDYSGFQKFPHPNGDGLHINPETTEEKNYKRIGENHWRSTSSTFGSDWWSIEPDVGRVAHGIPYREQYIESLGGSVVPLQARTAFRKLMGIK